MIKKFTFSFLTTIEARGQKSVILMLGRRVHMSQEKIESQTGKSIIVVFRFHYFNEHVYSWAKKKT